MPFYQSFFLATVRNNWCMKRQESCYNLLYSAIQMLLKAAWYRHLCSLVKNSHLSIGPCGLKQIDSQEKEPFSCSFFHALSENHYVIHFVTNVTTSKNHSICHAAHWLSKIFCPSESGKNEPYYEKGHEKLCHTIVSFLLLHCYRSHVPFKRCVTAVNRQKTYWNSDVIAKGPKNFWPEKKLKSLHQNFFLKLETVCIRNLRAVNSQQSALDVSSCTRMRGPIFHLCGPG